MIIEIDGWERNIRFSAAHFISHHGKCSRIHGHDYVISARIHGDKVGEIVIDFGEVKKVLKEIADSIDHKLIVSERFVKFSDDKAIIEYPLAKIEISRDSVYVIPYEEATAENIAEHICDIFAEKLRDYENINMVEIKVEEGRGQGAWASRILR